MKIRLRTLAGVLAASILLLTGCAGRETPPDFDRAYVLGILDTLYLGEYSEELMALAGMEDPARLEAEYEAGLDAEVDYFAYCFDAGPLTDASRARLKELYRDLYRLASYEVLPSEAEDDIHTVDVVIRPLDVIDRVIREDLDAFAARQKAAPAEGLSREEITESYVEGLTGLIRDRMEEPGYGKAETLTLEVGKDPRDGLCHIKGNGLNEVDERILLY